MKHQRRRQLHDEQVKLEVIAHKITGHGYTQWVSYRQMAATLAMTVEEVHMVVCRSKRVRCFRGWTIPKCPASDFQWIPFSDNMADWLIEPIGK